MFRTVKDAAAACHKVLCAGGDYGDDLSDLELRRDLGAAEKSLQGLHKLGDYT
jgi:hypothetical protein